MKDPVIVTFRHGPELILNELIKRLPGTVITHDMGACGLCAKPTESGMYILCLDCLRKEAKGLAERIQYLMTCE